MTNKEKFAEVFDVPLNAVRDECPIFCTGNNRECSYYRTPYCNNRWWNDEYKEQTDATDRT